MGSPIADAWNRPDRKWPGAVYIETTNRCNANCKACLNDKVLKKRATMDLDTFKQIATKVKARGLRIGAMFCFGEPLLDPSICEKYRFANQLDVLSKNHTGLNTNCSMLTEDRWDDLLFLTPNITLSFFNVGEAFERMTRLSWRLCYENALGFIRERDEVRPDYEIYIGCNRVSGSGRAEVEAAFAGCNVTFVSDGEVRFGASLEVLDRMRVHPWWRCDGHKGAMQIKADGSVEYCAYDIIEGITRFGNLLEDSWEALEAAFRAAWKAGSSLCRRCDYWYGAEAVIASLPATVVVHGQVVPVATLVERGW